MPEIGRPSRLQDLFEIFRNAGGLPPYETMKLRESGMPDEEYWETLFDISLARFSRFTDKEIQPM